MNTFHLSNAPNKYTIGANSSHLTMVFIFKNDGSPKSSMNYVANFFASQNNYDQVMWPKFQAVPYHNDDKLMLEARDLDWRLTPSHRPWTAERNWCGCHPTAAWSMLPRKGDLRQAFDVNSCANVGFHMVHFRVFRLPGCCVTTSKL